MCTVPARFILTEGLRRLPFILFFSVVSAIVIRTVLLLDSNKHVFSHKPGKCKIHVELADGGAAYFENVESLRYLFSTDGFKRITNSSYNAGIYFTEYPKSTAQKQPKQQKLVQPQQTSEPPPQDEAFIKAMNTMKFKRLSIIGNDELLKDFTPLGIGSHIEGSVTQKKYRLYVYVVNSRPQQPNRVEVFLFKDKEQKLVHQLSVEDPAFTSLSDIVVFGAGRFLVSNVFRWSNRWLQLLEFLTQREYGSLLMYDGKKVNSLVSGLQTPNGLFWEPSTRRLFVSLTNAEAVKVYNIRQDMTLIEHTQISVMSSPDQLYFQKSSGELWLTAHPITYQLLNLVFSGFQSQSASHVLRVRFQGNMDSWVLTEPLANNGTMLSAASALTLIDDYLLVGSRVAKAISCRMNDPLYA